jgi:hypothetical protein
MSTSFNIVAGKPTIDKDPNAVLDYTVDFTAWLDAASDAIASHTATGTGVTVQSSAVVGKTVVVWVSGGVVRVKGSVVVRITTTGGRVDDRTIFFKIKER